LVAAGLVPPTQIGGVGLLYRPGREVDLAELEMPAGVGEVVLGPGTAQDGDALFHARGPLPQGDAVAGELVGNVTEADAQVEAAAREDVDGRGVLGHVKRMVQG
jgi:hypothetical protein